MNKAIHNDIMGIIRQRHLSYESAYEKKRKSIYDKVPVISDIDNVIKRIDISVSYIRTGVTPPKGVFDMLMYKGQSMLDMDIPILEEIRASYINEREKAIKACDVSEPSPDEKYYCKMCHDTGYIDVSGKRRTCSCYKRILVDKLKTYSDFDVSDCNMDMFNLGFYSQNVNKNLYGINVCPREQMTDIYNRCMRFADRFSMEDANTDANNMMFIGGTGLGKTHMAKCIAGELLGRGVPVLYMPAAHMFKLFQSSFSSEEDNDSAQDLIDILYSVDLLIIDDLGIEKQTATRYAELLNILETREQKRNMHIRTLITTNLTPANIFNSYGERVASRILGAYDILRFAGDDIRLKSRVM